MQDKAKEMIRHRKAANLTASEKKSRELKCFGKEKPSEARELNRDGKAANLTDSEKLS